jgi:dipeptidyl aminopeptidase/acylaminoacyl peptidase
MNRLSRYRIAHANFLLSVFAVGLGVGGGPALAKGEQFTIHDVLSAPFPSELRAAPQGNRVAWILNDGGSRNIWVADATDVNKSNAHPITTYEGDDGVDIGDIRWSPAADLVVFTRGGSFEGGGPINAKSLPEGGPAQEIWVAAIDGHATRRLGMGHAAEVSPKGDQIAYILSNQIWVATLSSPGEPAQLIHDRGQSGSLSWSPDGQRLAFVSTRGDHAFIGVYDFGKHNVVWMTPSVDGDGSPTWAPDGQSLAFIRVPTSHSIAFTAHRSDEPWSIWVGDAASGAAHRIWRADAGEGSVFSPLGSNRQLFWAAGDKIVFPWERSGWLNLYAVSINSGQTVNLTPGEFEVFSAALGPHGDQIVYSANSGDLDRRHLWKVVVRGPGATSLTSGKTIEDLPVVTGDGRVVALQAGARMPLQPVAVDVDGSTHLLTPSAVPPTFPIAQLVDPQTVVVTSPDGVKIHAQLFSPSKSVEGRPHPAVVFFHGGPTRQMLPAWHPMGAYFYLYGLNQYLASKGYVVLSVNYRGGSGYGLKFREPDGFGAGGASEYQDILGAAQYLRSRSDVDSKRVGVYGLSYGGLMTALALSRSSDLFTAGVDEAGVEDWKTANPAFTSPGAPSGPADLAFKSSAISTVNLWRSPVLFVQGDDDRVVPFAQTVEMIEALRKAGNVQIDQLIIPDEIHDLMLRKSWELDFTATAAYFDKHLRQGE